MSKRTVLMNKLFSDSTPRKFKRVFAESALEAKNSDESVEYQEGAEDLVFSVEGDEVLVEDRANKEMTKVSFSEEDPNEIQLEAIEEDPEEEVEAEAEEVPSEEEALEEEIHTESENLPSVEVEVLNGPDGEHADDIVDDLKIDIEEGINDDEKSGTKRFSLRFKNYSERKARNFARLFSDMADQMEEAAGDDESEVEVGVEAEGEMTADALMEKANQLAAEVAEGVNKENAEAVKAKAEEILVEAEKLESNGSNCSFLKLMCNQYCDAATKAMSESDEEHEEDEEEQYEEGFEAGEQYEEGKEAEAADEGDQREFSEDAVEYVLVYDDGNLPDVIDSKNAECIKHRKSFPKSASNSEKYEWATKMAEKDGAPGEPILLVWEEDADGGNYVEAYSNTKQFSETDPKVTITVTNVEPTALSKLLGAAEESKEEEEETPEFSEPKVDPNLGEGRHFSTASQSTGVSFLLKSEIN